MKNKFGFTLAEVLITLVIIGVVAALTIPTAINKYKDEELKSQFKKAYSTLSQALTKTVMNDFYGYVNCTYYKVAETDSYDSTKTKTTDCSTFYTALAKNLQVQKICKGNSLSEGCIPTYKSYYTGSGCNGFTQNYVENVNYSYVLADGIIINIHGGNSSALFLVDINGHKAPNEMGKDLFSFTISRKSNNLTGYYLDPQACLSIGSDGRTTRDMMLHALAGKK